MVNEGPTPFGNKHWHTRQFFLQLAFIQNRLDIASMNIFLFKSSLSKSSPYARAKVKLNYTCKFHFRGLQSLRDTNLYRSGILSGKRARTVIL